MGKKNINLEWLLNKAEKSTLRYIEAESFILNILQLKWYQRFFLNKKIIKYFNDSQKYES